MYGAIENRMLKEPEWPKQSAEVKEKLSGPGYREIGTGNFVPEEEAFEYAVERVRESEDEKRDFVECFFSGNWIKED